MCCFLACVYIRVFTLCTFIFHRWKLHNLIKNRVLDTTTKAISFYSSAIPSPRSPHYRFKMDFVLFLWLPRESCPINCAKVYFLSNYYIHKYLMPLYKSLSLFNKREIHDWGDFLAPKTQDTMKPKSFGSCKETYESSIICKYLTLFQLGFVTWYTIMMIKVILA